MTTTTMNISLSEELKEKIKQQVERRHYSGVSDYILSLARKDFEQQEKQEALNTLLSEGIKAEKVTMTPDEIYSHLMGRLNS